MIHYVISEGLGNIIQTTPAFNYLSQFHDPVAVHCHPKFAPAAEVVYRHRAHICTAPVPKGQPRINSASIGYDGSKWDWNCSEVEANLRLAGCERPEAADKIGFCGFEPSRRHYDLIFCNGYANEKWVAKSFAHWNELASRFENVASIGLPGQHIPGTVDETGIGLAESLGLVRNARALVSNDTGFYHAAAVFGIKTVVLFTISDTLKNFDPDFHYTAAIISAGLPCQPCQFTSKGHWRKNRDQCHWACRNIDVDKIEAAIRGALV